MTFDVSPTAPNWQAVGQQLDVRAEIDLGTWTDISGYVFQDTTTVQRGHPDESTTAAPSVFAGTLDNSDGRFTSTNPMSPYYGLLGLNTDIRVSIPDASAHMRLETDSTSGALGPATSGLGSFEVWVDADLDNWYSPQTLACQWSAASNHRSWLLQLPGDGTVQLITTSDGTTGTALGWGSHIKLPFVHGRHSIRMSYDRTAEVITFYLGSYCGSWTSWATTTPSSGSLPLTYQTPAKVEVGQCSSTDYGEVGCQGKFYAFALIPSVGGAVTTAVASTDFTTLTAGVSSWTDAQSNPWGLEGTAEISNRNYRFHGEVAAWPQVWAPGGANARVALSSGGLLRRLGQANTAVQSPMRRAYTRLTAAGSAPVAYWSFEDLANSTQLASATGGLPFFWAGSPQLASFSGFACSAPLVTLNGATLQGVVPSYTTGSTVGESGAIVRFLMAVPSGGDTNNGVLARVYYSGSTLGHVDLTYTTGGNLTLTGYDTGNTVLWTLGPFAFGANGQLFRASIEMLYQGSSSYSASVFALVPGANTAGGGQSFPTTYTGTIGRVSRIVFNANALLAGTSVGHVSVQSSFTALTDMGPALAAYQGEAAGVRFQRLCSEEGIPFRGIGDVNDTVPMGVQSLETVSTLLQECADADRGMWFEPRQLLGFGYRTRASMLNQADTLQFDYSQDQLSNDLSPTLDDQTIKNDVTVTSQSEGSSSRQVLQNGSLMAVNGQAGRYDAQYTINLAGDGQLDDEAGWILHTSTVNESRWTAISTDLANTAMGSLYWNVVGAEIGDRVNIGDLPLYVAPCSVDQLIQGSLETLSRKALAESWNTIPASAFNVAVLDDPVYGRADTDGSTLTASVTPTATSLTVLSTNGPSWTTDSSDMPFDVGVGGEQVTVTAVAQAATPLSRVGAFLNDAALGASDFTTAYTNWQSLTGLTLGVSRAYYGPSSFGVPLRTDVAEMAAAGIKICIDLQPSYAPLSATDLANMETFLQALQTAGAVCDISLWHEPFFTGLTAVQYQAVYAYYGPTVRKYYPLALCFSGGTDTDPVNGYYPPASQYDKIVVDAYAGSTTTQVTNAEAQASANFKPFGIWEFNGATDVVNGQSQTAVTTFFTFIQTLMASRLAAGKPNADLILFNSGNPNFLGTGLSQAAGFEGGTANWQNSSNSTVSLGSVAHSGTGSLQMKANAAGNMVARHCNSTLAALTAHAMPVVAGQIVAASAWFKAAATVRGCQVPIIITDATGTVLSTTFGTSVNDSTSAWTQVSNNVTAPTNAAWAVVETEVASAALSEIHYVDDAYLGIVASSNDLSQAIQFPWDYRIALMSSMQTALNNTSYPQTMTVTRSVNGIVKAQNAGADVRLWSPPILSM